MTMDVKPTRARIWSTVIFISSLLLMQSAIAQQSEDAHEVADRILAMSQQSVQSALELAQQNAEQFEGDEQFDYAWGKAAQAVGDCQTAVFLFERVIQQAPAHIPARIALASCYLSLGNLDAANVEFSQLRQLTNDSDVLEKLDNLINYAESLALKNEPGTTGYIGLNTGYDSNPNNGVDDEYVDTPLLGQIRLFPQSRANSSALLNTQAGLTFTNPIHQHASWFASANLDFSTFSQSDALSRGYLNLSAGYANRVSDINFSAQVFYRPVWLDGDSLLNYFGTVFRATKPVSSDIEVGADVLLTQLKYDQLTTLDRSQYIGSIWLSTPTFGGVSRITLTGVDEPASDKQFDFHSRSGFNVGYRFLKQIDWQWAYQLSLEYGQTEFDSENPLFGVVREDDYFRLKLNSEYQLRTHWQLRGELSYSSNTSTLDIYEYDRSSVWIGVRYQF